MNLTSNKVVKLKETKMNTMNNDELVLQLQNLKKKHGIWLKRELNIKYPIILNELMNRTSFLDPNKNYPISARIYCLEHNITEQPICSNPTCTNPVNWNGKHAFRRCCCHDCSVRDPITQMKSKTTCEDRYGTQYSWQSEQVKKKIRAKWMKTLGVDNPQKSKKVQEKTRNTNNDRYGGPAPACSKEVVSRMEQTCQDRYGVSNFSYSPLFSAYHRKRIFHDNIWFDSSWEIEVYDFLKENHVPFGYSPSISIPYEYDGRQYTYHPDFIVNGKLYEVKGDHFFRVNESGHEVMVNPYRDPEWTDERYEWECGKYEAKHQCMISNNVTIIRECQMTDLKTLFGL